MEFAAPLTLAALPLAAALVWLARRRPRPALRWPALGPPLPPGRARWVPAARRTLALLGLGLALLAAAGPRRPDRAARLPVEAAALVLAVDVSGSMNADDFPAPGGPPVKRLDAVKDAFRGFVAGRPDDLVGLVAFAAWPDALAPLTLAHATLLAQLDALKPRTVPGTGETNVGDALAEALARLSAAGPRRSAVVLFSDGEHNAPPPALSPGQVARLAAARGVPVHVVDAGGVGAAADDEAAKRRAGGKANLEAVARITGGRYFEASDAAALAAALAEIDRLERRPVPSWQYRPYHEAAPALAAAALAAYACLALLGVAAGREVPA